MGLGAGIPKRPVAALPLPAQAGDEAQPPPPKRPRTSDELLRELLSLKDLLEAGLLSQEEVAGLKDKLLRGD